MLKNDINLDSFFISNGNGIKVNNYVLITLFHKLGNIIQLNFEVM